MGHPTETDMRGFDNYPKQLINSNDLQKLHIKWFSRDEIPTNINNGMYLLNLDDASGGGTHWVLFVINDKYIYYYDPFGDNHLLVGLPPQELINLSKKLHKKLYASKYWTQHIHSNMCGYNCLYLYYHLDPYKEDLTPKLFDKIVVKCFGTYPDKDDIKRIMSFVHKIL